MAAVPFSFRNHGKAFAGDSKPFTLGRHFVMNVRKLSKKYLIE